MSLDELRAHRWRLLLGKAQRSTINAINRELYARTGDENYLLGNNGY